MIFVWSISIRHWICYFHVPVILPTTNIAVWLNSCKYLKQITVDYEYCWFRLSKHFFLMKTILTPIVDKKYIKQFCHWSFFSDYARLQSSFHHFKNYFLIEHARWSIIILAFFRLWFRKQHMQSLFLHKLKQLFECSNNVVIYTIVKCFVAMIKNNSVFMTNDLTTKDRQNFDVYVRNFKLQYQQLLMNATFVFDVNFRSRFKTFKKNFNFNPDFFANVAKVIWTEFLTITQRQIQPTVVDNTLERSTRVNQYRNDTKRFNVHADIHFERIIAEYGLLNHCNCYGQGTKSDCKKLDCSPPKKKSTYVYVSYFSLMGRSPLLSIWNRLSGLDTVMLFRVTFFFLSILIDL